MNTVRGGAVIPSVPRVLADKQDRHPLGITNAIVDQIGRAGAARQIDILEGRGARRLEAMYLIVHALTPGPSVGVVTDDVSFRRHTKAVDASVHIVEVTDDLIGLENRPVIEP